MAKRKLTVGEAAKDTRDVPLVTEYVDSGGSIEDYFVVESCTVTKYGLLVVTSAFKGTLWKRSNDYKDMIEAIEEALTISGEKTLLLFAKATRSKAVEIAIDDELPYGSWERIDNETVLQVDHRGHSPAYKAPKLSMRQRAGTVPDSHADNMQGTVPAPSANSTDKAASKNLRKGG